MYYASPKCRFCEQGAVGFRLCSDGVSIVLVCDECDGTWVGPEDLSVDKIQFPKDPGFTVMPLGCSISKGQGARWATLDEIRKANLENFVAGQGTSLSE